MKIVRKVKLENSSELKYWDLSMPKHQNYILANGCLVHNTGVGFSVESYDVDKLPAVADEFHNTDTTIVVEDSRLGWAKAYRELISLLYGGQIPQWDTSKLRPAGARLKTFGGRSSGPAPLIELFKFTVAMFRRAAGRKLTTIECHDLMCKIAEVVIVGGVRRSALISLSDLSDYHMREAKIGSWWNTAPHRRLSNNSAVYTEKPEMGLFMKEWTSLYESKSGERGIFSRYSARNVINNANDFRRKLFGEACRIREWHDRMGANPCSEILLRPYETCNLTEQIVKATDTEEDLIRKTRLATILGTIQSALDDFKYVNKKWKQNVQDERLLGVSLTGIFDNELTNGKLGNDALKEALYKMKKVAIETNIEWAKKLGINQSVAITCVKPSGTTSALCGTSSGIHPAHNPYYIRYVRNDKKDPVTQFMIDKGFPYEDDAYDPNNMICFKFPMKASETAICRKDYTAIQHLHLWLTYQKHWCEHKPSVTISVKEDEWLKVGAWVYDHFDWVSGVSFLPSDEDAHTYQQAPFTDCNENEYNELVKIMPVDVDWTELKLYEKEDSTTSMQVLACTGSEGCLL
jgi:ribonucleoside-triphosphate reductase